MGTETVSTGTFQTSSWLGIINLGSSSSPPNAVTNVIGQPQILGSSLYYFLDTANENSPYIFTYNQETISSTGWVPTKNWTTSTWYGKKPYYQQTQETQKFDNIADTSIEADLPVQVQFTGSTTGNIVINSPNSSVTLLGSLTNTTGNTTVIAGGTITTPEASASTVLNPNSPSSTASAPSNVIEGVDITLQAGTGIGSASTTVSAGVPTVTPHPVDVLFAGPPSAQSLTATTTNGAIYLASSAPAALQLDEVFAGGDQAVNLSVNGAINGVVGGADLIGGGNVEVNAIGSVGAQGTPIQLDVGQGPNDKLNMTAGGNVYLEQQQGNLQIFQLSTPGAVDITVDDGSLISVNTNIQQDPRTVAQLEAGSWTALQLTDSTGAQAEINSTLNEYASSQQQQYQTYWQYQNELVDGAVVLPAEQINYYTGIFTSQAEAKYTSSDPTRQADIASFVSGSIATLELSATQQYYALATIYGPDGSYQQGAANVFSTVTDSNVSATTPSKYAANDRSRH